MYGGASLCQLHENVPRYHNVNSLSDTQGNVRGAVPYRTTPAHRHTMRAFSPQAPPTMSVNCPTTEPADGDPSFSIDVVYMGPGTDIDDLSMSAEEEVRRHLYC